MNCLLTTEEAHELHGLILHIQRRGDFLAEHEALLIKYENHEAIKHRLEFASYVAELKHAELPDSVNELLVQFELGRQWRRCLRMTDALAAALYFSMNLIDD